MTMSEKPALPYYAVIFTSCRTDDDDGYAEMARQMVALGTSHPGCLGFESVNDGDQGISVSYWKDLDSINRWKQNADHMLAQKAGREKWYGRYTTRIAKVERHYSFEK